jgi:hypothetical protein
MRPDGFASNGDGFHPSKLKFEIKQLEINADLAKDGRDKEWKEKILTTLTAANFLVFTVTLLIIISGFYFMNVSNKKEDVIEYWKCILPLITTYVGFAVGRPKRNNQNER